MTRRLIKRFARSRSGTTAVEFGLVCVPFLLMVFGSIEFGRAAWTREALQEAAIGGARCMGLVQNSCGTSGTYSASMTQAYVQQRAAAWAVSLSSSDITLNAAASCGGVSGFSQVSITYTFSTVVPLFLKSLSSGIPMTATACFPNHS